MPGLITHHYIIAESLRTCTITVPEVKTISNSFIRASYYATQNQWVKYDTDAICREAGCAFVGSVGPDLFYLETGGNGLFLADLMHYNRPGQFVIRSLQAIKREYIDTAVLTIVNIRRLAYLMGHASHIAADINIHPYVNSIVAAYPDNRNIFANWNAGTATGMMSSAGSWLIRRFNDAAPMDWKFHNKLEHFQDAYVLHKLFRGQRGFGVDWQNVNIGRAASAYFYDKKNKEKRFILDYAKNFYRYSGPLTSQHNLERDKFGFFNLKNELMHAKVYYEDIIPPEDAVDACPQLVQGRQREVNGVFDSYLEMAIQTTHVFWSEMVNYLFDESEDPQDSLNDDSAWLKVKQKYFPQLSKQWNLDTGLAIDVSPKSDVWNVPETKTSSVIVAGSIGLVSVHTNEIEDIHI